MSNLVHQANKTTNEPLYNIGVVTRMTGISKATLRAWERRYGFPESNRTSGGHRLYSEKDIIHLRWVKNRIDQGMQTAQAIRALHHQEAGAELEQINTKGGELSERSSYSPEEIVTSNPLMAIYQRRLLQAFINHDIESADQIIGEALASSSPENIILDLFVPTLNHIGHAWENKIMDIAVEHLATNYLRHRLMMWMLSAPPSRNTGSIVLACAPGEWHEISLLIIATLLRRRRWPISYLGQAMPLDDLSHYVQEIKPAVVVLVAMSEVSAHAIQVWPEYLPETAHTMSPVITYGGRVFVKNPELRLRMPGLYLGDTLYEGLNTIEALLIKQA